MARRENGSSEIQCVVDSGPEINPVVLVVRALAPQSEVQPPDPIVMQESVATRLKESDGNLSDDQARSIAAIITSQL